MFCALLCLPLAVLGADMTDSQESQDCFRWNETGESALVWRTQGDVQIPMNATKIFYTHFRPVKRHNLNLVLKSAGQFFGGLTQKKLWMAIEAREVILKSLWLSSVFQIDHLDWKRCVFWFVKLCTLHPRAQNVVVSLSFIIIIVHYCFISFTGNR